MKLEKVNCLRYRYNDTYSIEIMEAASSKKEEMWEAWLVEKDYGLKSFIVGVLKKTIPTAEAFLKYALINIDLEIKLFEESKLVKEDT